MGRGYKSWVVGVGVGEELIMIINMNIINISYILAYGTRARSARGSQNCAILSIIPILTAKGAFWLSVNSVVVYLPCRKDATEVFFAKLTQINTL